jgi:triosephosphate isomerase
MNKNRTPFVGGNWKMNGTRTELSQLITEIQAGAQHFSATQIAVFPSFVYLSEIASALHHSQIKLGAQNQCEYEQGAYTGEVSPIMLKEMGCSYVLLGHSERRHIYHETDQQIAEKFALATKHGLSPVLCVGETLAERETGKTQEVILMQLNVVLNQVGVEAFHQAIVAYEPVWAIGTGKTATPAQAQEIHAFLREHFAKESAKIAAGLRIIYGGSVKAGNAAEIFAQPDIDGGLIGGASLQAKEFMAICQAANG